VDDIIASAAGPSFATSAHPMRHLWPTSIWSPGGFVTSALTNSRKDTRRSQI